MGTKRTREVAVDTFPIYPGADIYPVDRRKRERYQIAVEVRFQWQTQDGHTHNGVGITRDVGIAGLFVERESVPPVDSVLKLIVTLPATPKFDALRLSGSALVRHVQQDTRQTCGFGCAAVLRPEVPMPTESVR